MNAESEMQRGDGLGGERRPITMQDQMGEAGGGAANLEPDPGVDLLPATPANMRRLYAEHGNNLFAVAPATGDECSVNPNDYADFSGLEDDTPFLSDGEPMFLALRGPGYRLLSKAAVEPAYSLLGNYKGKAVSVTVYTHNGPEAALDLAQDAWGEELEIPITESVDVVAIAAGEVQWIDFDNKETWPK